MIRWTLPVLLATAALAGDWRAMLAPGPVSAVHAEHAGNCDACHSAFDGLPDERCLNCHTDLAGRISSEVGWHATVDDKPCNACHVDHHGADVPPTRPEARKAFDHAATGFALTGGHAGIACATCHEGPMTGLEGGCATCHAPDDPHQSTLGPDCGACHDAASWTAGIKRVADHETAMDGGHAGKECADCHLHGAHLEPAVPCASCHEQGHDGTTTPCSDCHQVSGWKPAKFDHGPCTCAFPGKHQTVECLACHADFDFTDTPTRCEGCHDPGKAHQPLGGCAACHTALSWKDGRFDHNKQSKFHLEGAHLAVSCTQCHQLQGVFKGAPTACAGCHGTDAHPDFGPCADCHAIDGFSPSTFDHAKTGFALTGKHGQAPCADCHTPREVPGVTPAHAN